MTPDGFKAWRERMGFNRVQAAEALGTGRNQPQKYEEGETDIPAYIELATRALEARQEPATPKDAIDLLADFERRNPREKRLKEIIAVTMHRGSTRPFPEIHRYYVEWFASNGLKTLPTSIEDRLMVGLKAQILTENRKMEQSRLGSAEPWMSFDELDLLAIFTTERAKALIDAWADPIDLKARFYGHPTSPS